MNNTVLIITAESADAERIRQGLAAARDGPFHIAWVRTLSEGLTRLREGQIDIILTDLFLPDSDGMDTFDRLFLDAPGIPIMTLASEEDEPAAIEAVLRGAQGFLSKGYFQSSLVPQALRSIIHRKAVEEALFLEKERGRVILESIGEAVISTDLAGNTTYMNAVAERMTGCSMENARWRPFAEVASIVDETLVKHADAAMYHAKKFGRNNYQFFNGEMNVRAVERQIIESHQRSALSREEFVLHYQPKVNLVTGKISGAEALVRWRHPQEDAGLQAGRIAVNVSATEFRSQGYLEQVRGVLDETRFDACNLELELTESVLMRNVESSQATLSALKELGIKLVVDDFGTGYSSLSYLQQFPIDALQIDQAFVRDAAPGSDNGIIVAAVIGMGSSLRLRVVLPNFSKLAFQPHHSALSRTRPKADEFSTLLIYYRRLNFPAVPDTARRWSCL